MAWAEPHQVHRICHTAGVSEEIADSVGFETNPAALGGTFDASPVTNTKTPFVPYHPAGADFDSCPQDAKIGGEGFAFVLQWEGPDAAGCGGAGLGWAGAPGCDGLAGSVAVQFDTHQNVRIERHRGDNMVQHRASLPSTALHVAPNRRP